MEYGRVIEHILAAWDLAAPKQHQGLLQLAVREMEKDGSTLRQMQAFAAGRLHDGLAHGNW